MNIIMISSEYGTLAKAGGLADAVAALSIALVKRKHRVYAVLPRYGWIDEPQNELQDTGLSLSLSPDTNRAAELTATVFTTTQDGVTLYFVDNPALFNREGIYGPNPADAYSDNLQRFSALTYGALQLIETLKLPVDIIHTHDWPTALVPVYLPHTSLAGTSCIFSIHNIGYQGIFGSHEVRAIGLDKEQLAAANLFSGNDINLMQAAIHNATYITTVSPQYALEIQQPRFGFGLHRIIQDRANSLQGIVNGIDDTWDPATDLLIPYNYTADNLADKEQCRRVLQEQMELPNTVTPIEQKPNNQSVTENNPPAQPALIGIVTRLVEQKGIDLLFQHGAAEKICAELPVQLVILGSGAPWCEAAIQQLARYYPNIAAHIGHSEGLAHLIEAGCDFFLMPSQYEPCGLNQMYSMRYGTIPIVTRTGGFINTVDAETGFFIEEYTAEALFTAVQQAVNTYTSNPEHITVMRKAGMQRNFSWNSSAKQYEALYHKLTDN